MSREATLVTASFNRRSFRCYNCNHAFHITVPLFSVSSSFRCPNCFHHHLLSYNTIASYTPHSQTNSTTFHTTDPIFTTIVSSDLDSNTEPSDFSLLFGPTTHFRSPQTLQSFIDSLPRVTIYESSKSCSICIEEFEIHSSASQLPCNHLFHFDCIHPWLNQSNTCPLCRRNLLNEGEGEDEYYYELERIMNELQYGYNVVENGDERDPGDMHDEDGDTLMVDA